MEAGPRSSCTNFGCTFFWKRSDAQVCQRSWNVIPESLAFFTQIDGEGFRTLAEGAKVSYEGVQRGGGGAWARDVVGSAARSPRS